MTQQKAYIYGFIKTAGAYRVDPVGLLKLASQLQMYKQAGKFGRLTRIITKLSPRVSPAKQNWLTRLFTDTSIKSTFLRGSTPEDITIALRKTYNAKGMPIPKEVMKKAPISGSPASGSPVSGSAGQSSVTGSTPVTDFVAHLNDRPYKDVVTTRINPLKVLAGLGLLGGAAGGTTAGVAMHQKNKKNRDLKRKILLGSAGLAGILALAAGGKLLSGSAPNESARIR